LHEFFDKKINAVSLFNKTLSLLNTNNRYQYIFKPINSKFSANIFAVFALPTGRRASEGHSINFAKQNSRNVSAVKTQKKTNNRVLAYKASFLAHAKHVNSYNLVNATGVIHESNKIRSHAERGNEGN